MTLTLLQWFHPPQKITWFEWLPRSLMTLTQKNQNNEHELKYTYENSSPTIPPTKNDVSQHIFCK